MTTLDQTRLDEQERRRWDEGQPGAAAGSEAEQSAACRASMACRAGAACRAGKGTHLHGCNGLLVGEAADDLVGVLLGQAHLRVMYSTRRGLVSQKAQWAGPACTPHGANRHSCSPLPTAPTTPVQTTTSPGQDLRTCSRIFSSAAARSGVRLPSPITL